MAEAKLMLSCVKAAIAHLHIPVMQNVQFKRTAGYFCPVASPETPSVLLRRQIKPHGGLEPGRDLQRRAADCWGHYTRQATALLLR